MGNKNFIGYLILVVIIAVAAFSLDIFLSQVGVELNSISFLNSEGNIIKTLQISYPLWHQFLSLLANFLYGLSAAVFITVFVANKIQKDQQEKKEQELEELHNAININVFDSLFKTIIPADVFEVIKHEIIENKILRKNAKWIYDFSEVDDKILCRMTNRYEIHNLSQEDVIDPIILELFSLGDSRYEVIEAECISSDKKEVIVKLDPNDKTNNKNVDIQDSDGRLVVEYSVKVPAKSYVEYKTVIEKTYDKKLNDTQGTKVPVIGADLIVNYPANYEFDIVSSMSNKFRLITESKNQKIYSLDGAILPWQSFIYYLKPC
ncbi:hypothetical protein [Candidatus Thiosymbion oneisti]|uniref:hypothetical protein n=1 Tax=Candidatus Thiosymbion oneisti TaxID=589554 RepID=UPI00105E5300|nr:hypothetical protein [Candidatus Thiosymbion oneisti]